VYNLIVRNTKTNAPSIHTAPQSLPLSAHVCFSLYSASLAMTKAYKPLLAALGITYPQYLVMVCLWQNDAQLVGDLGKSLCLDSGTLTPLLKRLETAQLVNRQRSSADERQVVVTLTTQGQAMRHTAATIPECVAKACGLDIPVLVALGGTLNQLRDSLQVQAPIQ
jgi:MarR family transcriptional regulator, organic hydroperoxide resistance regulator